MIEISDDFTARGLTVRLGCVEAAVAVGPGGADLEAALDAAAEALPARLAGTPIAELPAVAATRRAYRALGKDPARYRPAAEALMRRVKQGKGLYRVNNVVDVNNLISLRTGFSIGTYDLERVRPPLLFRRAGEGETYAGIGRGPLNLEGLPVFADAAGGARRYRQYHRIACAEGPPVESADPFAGEIQAAQAGVEFDLGAVSAQKSDGRID